MANVLHFDLDNVLDQFLNLFWAKGYRATTTKDLAECAGISESSLFNSFRNKREIYINSLRRYNERGMVLRRKMENAESALEGIRSYWVTLARNASDPLRSQGCMITNATVEVTGDPEISDYVKATHREYDKAFKKTLDRAVVTEELRPDTDTQALAQYLSHSAQGLRLLSRINPDQQNVQNIVDLTMSTLDQFRP